jgi:signal transduction histidine kinase
LPSIVLRDENNVEAIAVSTPDGISSEVAVDQTEGIRFETRWMSPPLIPAMSTIYGFNLGRWEITINERRSDQVVRAPIHDPQNNVIGYIELSHGPAYGLEIVDDITQGWLIASTVAVVFAAIVGLIISRRISAPLLALTDVTTRMTGGNLSARADVNSRDEVGTLAKSFNEMANRVEETIIALRRFVADAAHELHTPLTALRTNLELIINEDSEAKRQGFVERAQAQVMRLETLTNSLLELSRLESGEIQREIYLLSLNDLLCEISEIYASQAEQKGLEFVLELPDQETLIAVNEEQLRRAVENLLENAIKFTPRGGTIRIGLSHYLTNIEIWVQDTGIGIPDADLPQLFSRFHRGRNAVEYPGSGLGLAIVKAIADYHNGHVMAENQVLGARLSLRLPLSTQI